MFVRHLQGKLQVDIVDSKNNLYEYVLNPLDQVRPVCSIQFYRFRHVCMLILAFTPVLSAHNAVAAAYQSLARPSSRAWRRMLTDVRHCSSAADHPAWPRALAAQPRRRNLHQLLGLQRGEPRHRGAPRLPYSLWSCSACLIGMNACGCWQQYSWRERVCYVHA